MVRGAAAVASVILVGLLPAGCGGSSESGDNESAAPPHAPTVNGVAAYVATSRGRTVVVTGALDDKSWRTHAVPGDPAPGRVRLAASADGRVVAISVFSEEVTSLHALKVSDASIRRLRLPQHRVRVLPAVAPDGAAVALAGDVDLSVAPTDGGLPKRVPALSTPAPTGTSLGTLRWSPDGRSLLYELWHTDPDDPRPATTGVELFVLPLDHPQSRALATVLGPDSGPAAWSPDSRRVAVAGDPRSNATIEIVAVRGGAKAEVIDVVPADLAWTRRGIYTFTGDQAGSPSDLVLVDPDSSYWRRAVGRQAGVIVAPPSGDVVAVVAWPRVRVFTPTGESVLDRTLRGAPDASPSAQRDFTVVLVDP